MVNELRDRALAIATAHGFTDASFGEDIALMHSELSEALEGFREGYKETEVFVVDGKPCGIPIEIADLIIRALHFCGKHGIDIERAIELKMTYNESRPYKHGKVL